MAVDFRLAGKFNTNLVPRTFPPFDIPRFPIIKQKRSGNEVEYYVTIFYIVKQKNTTANDLS